MQHQLLGAEHSKVESTTTIDQVLDDQQLFERLMRIKQERLQSRKCCVDFTATEISKQVSGLEGFPSPPSEQMHQDARKKTHELYKTAASSLTMIVNSSFDDAELR